MKKLLSLICALSLLICALPTFGLFQAFAGEKLTLKDDSLYTIDSANDYLIIQSDGVKAADVVANFTGTNVKVFKNSSILLETIAVGTGDTVCLMSGDTALDTLEIVILGDVNGDGDINIKDALKTLRVAATIDSLSSPVFAAAADVVGNDGINVIDARKILRVAAGFESSIIKFPATKAEILRVYKAAVDKITNSGAAGYTEKEWQEITSTNFENTVLNSLLPTFITTADEAVPVVYLKGTQTAKDSFPACTMIDSNNLSAASCAYTGGNYVIQMIVEDEDTPQKGSSIVGQITNSVVYWEDVESSIEGSFHLAEGGDSHLVYDDFTVTCTITPQAEFMSLTHFATVNAQINETLEYTSGSSMPVVGTMQFLTTAEYTDFTY